MQDPARPRPPVPDRAAIFVQRGGPSADRQIKAGLVYCNEEHYPMLAIVPPSRPDDAVQLVRDRRVNVIVTGFDSKAAQQLAADLDDLGRVEVIHPQPRVIEPPRQRLGTIGDLILRWFRRGKSVREIAAEIEEPTSDVREILRKYGEAPD